MHFKLKFKLNFNHFARHASTTCLQNPHENCMQSTRLAAEAPAPLNGFVSAANYLATATCRVRQGAITLCQMDPTTCQHLLLRWVR